MTRRFPCPKCNTIGWKVTIRSEPGSRYSKLTDMACLNCGHEIYFDNIGFVKEETVGRKTKMIDKTKVQEAFNKTMFFWQVMDLSEAEQLQVAKEFLLKKGEKL